MSSNSIKQLMIKKVEIDIFRRGWGRCR